MQLPDNELDPRVLASSATNPFAQNDSASRAQMEGGHLTQTLVIEGAEPRRTQAGSEREFGKATFKIVMPANGEIFRVIEKFPSGIARDSIKLNPLTVVVYRDNDNGEFGMVELKNYHCMHQNFGFNYKYNPKNHRKVLTPKSGLLKDSIIADSPCVDEHGNYNFGLEAKVAMMSIPAIIEDGMRVSRQFLERLAYTGFESRSAGWGKNYYPLNLYGTDEVYKPFPDIGDTVRPDGLLFALRRLQEEEDYILAPVEMTPSALRTPDYFFDRLVWAEPGSKVVDIKIHHNIRNNVEPTPPKMAVQTQKYYAATKRFYAEIIQLYNDLRRQYGTALRLTEPLHALIVEALIYNGDPARLKSIQLYRRIPLDDWRVELTLSKRQVPNLAAKITDLHGNKGVIVSEVDEQDMPFDPITGERADVVMDAYSRIKRMNSGGLYEQYINASANQLSKDIRVWCSTMGDAGYQKAWDALKEFYGIVSPLFLGDLLSERYTAAGGSPRHHVDCVLKDGIYINFPTNNPVENPTMIRQLRDRFPAPMNPVTFRGEGGEMVVSQRPVLIGSLYMVLLEKTGNDWMGVSSAKLQHFGIPAKMTQQDRHAMPGRVNPVRNLGESEGRSVVGVTKRGTLAKLMESSNNPNVHKHICRKIMEAEQPTNIPVVWDTNEIPMGGNRSAAYVNHVLQCSGIELYDVQNEIDDGAIYREDETGVVETEFEIDEKDDE